MRTIRALTIATAVVAMLPSLSAAQSGRQFKDAWFWGIKAGGLGLAGDSAQTGKQAPLAGVDWLITRTHGGLYVSGAQSFFTRHAVTLRDRVAGPDSGFRLIDLKNMRKLDMALIGFPGEHLRFHPYVGVGFSLQSVADAQPEGPFGNSDQALSAAEVIQANRTAFSPLIMAGGQYRLDRFSVFGQASFSPMNTNFLLYNGKSYTFGYEFGLRYNFGTSISRD